MAPETGVSAAGLYAATQGIAVAKKYAAGETSPGEALAGVGRVLKSLEGFAGNLDRGDKVLAAAVKVLGAGAEAAIKKEPALAAATKGEEKPKDTYTVLGRDSSGLKIQKRRDAATAEKSTSRTDRLGRDGSGCKVQKRCGS